MPLMMRLLFVSQNLTSLLPEKTKSPPVPPSLVVMVNAPVPATSIGLSNIIE